jgi:hypothetical protein
VENGVNPEALAAVVKELRREAANLQVRTQVDAVESQLASRAARAFASKGPFRIHTHASDHGGR